MDADLRPDASPGIARVDADLRLGARPGIVRVDADFGLDVGQVSSEWMQIYGLTPHQAPSESMRVSRFGACRTLWGLSQLWVASSLPGLLELCECLCFVAAASLPLGPPPVGFCSPQAMDILECGLGRAVECF